MRIGHVQQSRPSYYDRNATSGVLRYIGSALAPHSDTVRATYTVPSGKKGWVDNVSLTAYRNTAAGTPGLWQAYSRYTPLAGLATTMLLAQSAEGPANSHLSESVASMGALGPGDAIDLLTADGSTGGTVTYILGVKYSQYDA